MKTKRLTYLTPERLTILNHIWNRALANGRELEWQAVFLDHPDWADKLGWKDPVCRRNAYQFIGRKRRQPEGAHTAAGLLPPEPSPTTDLHFCPRCGFNISMLHAAFQVAMKHTQQ